MKKWLAHICRSRVIQIWMIFLSITRKVKKNDSLNEYLKEADNTIAGESESQYINYNFILGNFAEVKRLWNTA